MLDVYGIKCVQNIEKNKLFEIKFEKNNLQPIKEQINSLEKPLDKYTFYIYQNYVTTYNLDCVHVVNQWEKVTNKLIEELLEQELLEQDKK